MLSIALARLTHGSLKLEHTQMAGTLPQRHSIQRADWPNKESKWKKDGKQNLLAGVWHSRLCLQNLKQPPVRTGRNSC